MIKVGKSQRPRELALRNGIESLNDAELLALIINTGTKDHDVMEIANLLLSTYKSLFYLSNTSYASLQEEKGLSKIKALQLCSVFEIAHRLEKEKYMYVEPIDSYTVVFEKYHFLYSNEHETLMLLMLDHENHVIKEKKIVGKDFEILNIQTSEIIYELLISKAKYFILVHTHLDDNVYPTDIDIISTSNLYHLSMNLGIDLLDHIIIGKTTYYSFKKEQKNDAKKSEENDENIYKKPLIL